MEKTSVKIFSDKVKLIYEYNKKSPLFVRAAFIEIENNNFDNAVLILRQGLKVYPENPVAILLLAWAYACLGKKQFAAKLIRKGSNIIHSEETYNFYMEEMNKMEKSASIPGFPREKIFFNEITDNNDKESNSTITEKENEEDPVKQAEAIENRLEQLAKTIAAVKLRPPGDDKHIEINPPQHLSENNLVVSETLAEIYISQQQYNEAIKVYNNLIKMKPDKIEYYSDKIAEIKTKYKV